MSATVEKRVFGPGDDSFVDQAWELKETIRREDGFLQQRRGFFMDAYRRSTVHAFVTGDDELVGFAATRRDGYILFLAVAEGYRGEGFGERLVAEVAANCGTVTCHARTTNENALEFYEHIGFSVERRIENYYEDGAAAFYLRLGEDAGLRDKLSELFRR